MGPSSRSRQVGKRRLSDKRNTAASFDVKDHRRREGRTDTILRQKGKAQHARGRARRARHGGHGEPTQVEIGTRISFILGRRPAVFSRAGGSGGWLSLDVPKHTPPVYAAAAQQFRGAFGTRKKAPGEGSRSQGPSELRRRPDSVEACYLQATARQPAAKPIRSALLVIDAPRMGRIVVMASVFPTSVLMC